jgi:rubrerythrin
MLQLQDKYPALAQNHRSKIIRPDEAYVELLQCSLNEAKEIKQLLETEGIACMIEKNEDFRFHYRLEGGSQIADQKGLIVKVRAMELSKARALLEWEAQQELDEEAMDFGMAEETDLLTCPSCEAELSPRDPVCPECGIALEEVEEEESSALGGPDEQESYRCSACGAPCDLADPICPTCGARFDH